MDNADRYQCLCGRISKSSAQAATRLKTYPIACPACGYIWVLMPGQRRRTPDFLFAQPLIGKQP